MWVGDRNKKQFQGDGWEGQQEHLIGSQIPRGKVICACFFFKNNFAYICHFTVCVYIEDHIGN